MGRMNEWLASAVIALNFCGPLLAGDVTEADINSWVALWQKREGLEQWKISVRVVRHSELGPGIDGDINALRNYGTATIRVLCAKDMERVRGRSPASARRESELVIVHELMHLVLVPLEGDGNWSREEEARIEAVTEAFSEMLLQRRVPDGVSEAQFINSQISRWPGKPAPEVKKQVMLKLVRAMNAVAEDDVMALAAVRGF